MRRICFCIFMVLCLCLSACSGTDEDLSTVLEGAFEAELSGTVCGIAFEAGLTAAARSATGVTPTTLTFYAPQELSGTTLSRDGEGKVTMCYDGICIEDVGGVGLVLLSLFPTGQEARRAAVNEAGNTVVLFEHTEVEFSREGVPLFVKNDDVEAKIVSWRRQ